MFPHVLKYQSGIPSSFCILYYVCPILLQVPVEDKLVSGFGPVVSDGYGICYNPQKRQMLFAVSSFKKSRETDTTKFTMNLFEALHQMKNIFESQSSTAKL